MPPFLPYDMPNPLVRAAVQVQTSRIKEAIDEVVGHKMKDVVNDLTAEIRKVRTASDTTQVEWNHKLQKQLKQRDRLVSRLRKHLEDSVSAKAECDMREQEATLRLEQNVAESTRLTTEIATLQETVRTTEARMEEALRGERNNSGDLSERISQIVTLLTQEKQRMVQSLQECNDKLAPLQEEKARLEKEIEEEKLAKRAENERMEGIQQELDATKRRVENLGAEIQTCEGEKDAQQQQLDRVQQELQEEREASIAKLEEYSQKKRDTLRKIVHIIYQFEGLLSTLHPQNFVHWDNAVKAQLDSLQEEEKLHTTFKGLYAKIVESKKKDGGENQSLKQAIEKLKIKAEEETGKVQGEHKQQVEELETRLREQEERISELVQMKDACKDKLGELMVAEATLVADKKNLVKSSEDLDKRLRAALKAVKKCTRERGKETKQLARLKGQLSACRKQNEDFKQRLGDDSGVSRGSKKSSDAKSTSSSESGEKKAESTSSSGSGEDDKEESSSSSGNGEDDKEESSSSSGSGEDEKKESTASGDATGETEGTRRSPEEHEPTDAEVETYQKLLTKSEIPSARKKKMEYEYPKPTPQILQRHVIGHFSGSTTVADIYKLLVAKSGKIPMYMQAKDENKGTLLGSQLILVDLRKFEPKRIFDGVKKKLDAWLNKKPLDEKQEVVVRLFCLIVYRLTNIEGGEDGVTYVNEYADRTTSDRRTTKYYFMKDRKTKRSPQEVSGGSGFSLSNLFIWL